MWVSFVSLSCALVDVSGVMQCHYVCLYLYLFRAQIFVYVFRFIPEVGVAYNRIEAKYHTPRNMCMGVCFF